MVENPTCEELHRAGEVDCIIPPDVCRDLPRRQIQKDCGCVRKSSLELNARNKQAKETKLPQPKVNEPKAPTPKGPKEEKDPKTKEKTKAPSKAPPKKTPGSYKL